jgi:hypothetical protein
LSISQITIQSPVNETQFTDTSMGNAVDAVKASSTLLLYVMVDNSANAGAPCYLKLYNVTSGSVTVGTTACDECIYVPNGAIITQLFYTSATPGKTFGTALSAACVTTGGTAGITSPSSSVKVTLVYV